MRVQLKGLKVVTKRLADGRRARYYYAWVGGPRIEGEPGSIEFTASYNAAIATKPHNTRAAMLCALTDAYRDSGDFLGLADRTRQDYTKLIKQIVAEFGEMPIAALADRRTRAESMTWRDGLAKKSRRQCRRRWTVLARTVVVESIAGFPMRTPVQRRQALQRLKGQQDMVGHTFASLSREGQPCPLSGPHVGPLDWPAARRSVAAQLGGLRRRRDPPQARQDGTARHGPCGSAAQGRTRRNEARMPAHPCE